MSLFTHFHHILTTGLAMFSMFFGAGNIVFPLAVGQHAGSMAWPAIIGLLVGAVGMPFMGLISMTYFEGRFKEFFGRIGQVPGYLVTLFVLLILGPVSAMPRCIAMAYGTLSMYMPGCSLLWFSIISTIIVFAATVRKSRIIDLLGDVLSPLLIVCLAVIVVKGLLYHSTAAVNEASTGAMLLFGLKQGYNTMDLLSSLFFSGVTIVGLRHLFGSKVPSRVIGWYAFQAALIGAGLLGLVYIGFALLASYHSSALASVNPDAYLAVIAHTVLGKAGGFFVSMAVALACLTTVITLTAVFADFLLQHAWWHQRGYYFCLLFTLLSSCAMANVGFAGIVAMMSPILVVIYPALVVLTIMNMVHKVSGITTVKAPVFGALALSFMVQYGSSIMSLLP